MCVYIYSAYMCVFSVHAYVNIYSIVFKIQKGKKKYTKRITYFLAFKIRLKQVWISVLLINYYVVWISYLTSLKFSFLIL